MHGSESPREAYTARLAGYQEQKARQAFRERIVGNARLGVFALGLLLAYFAATRWLSPWWLALPGAIFVGLVWVHDRVLRAARRAGHGIAFYEKALARLEGRWSGKGQQGNRFMDPAHPCALDLDLFGTGSLFELLSTARIRTGEDTLASWLMTPADPEEICGRQQAIMELRCRLDLREHLALLAASVPAGVDLDGLAAWGTAAPVVVSPRVHTISIVLPVLAMLALLGWLLWATPLSLLLIVVLAEVGFNLVMGPPVQAVLAPVERRAHDLALLAGILACLERESFTSPRLLELQKRLQSEGQGPSQRIAQLGRLIDLLNSRKNQLFMPLAYLLLWTTHLAFQLEAWRFASGEAIGRWLATVGDFEALCALATYAYEHPSDPFPEITSPGPSFEGEGLGHPLLPSCVPNDLHLGEEKRLLVVSGSNMSGKSTFLRTVGINTVLALAGAPVRATRLRLSCLSVGATLRIQDSLQGGTSRFYAEITRIRQLMDLAAGPRPLLFLLDEILHGTNSHDRRQGAEAVVRGLLQRGAIGLITTHDLSLAEIADRLAPRAGNVHFADHLVDGTMTFDYRLQPGVVQHSNAIALMRAVGLEV
ncbi:MAG TPA: DNA mismatch repair protein MutS [Isosphaeraceae bacterium]|nr:DNA mismatch repair protein MutS [Isosphaeraceae bacterium]